MKKTIALVVCAAGTTVLAQPVPLPSTWTGMWFNDTFGSSGALTASFAASGSDLMATVDADGNVFGLADPPADTFMMPSDGAGGYTFNGSAFGGAATATLASDGTFSSSITDALGGFDPANNLFGFGLVTFDGVFTATTFSGTYEIFQDPTTAAFATGRIQLAVPAPGAAAIAGVGVLTAIRRRR